MAQYVLHWQRIVDSINGMPKKAHVQVGNLTARYNYIIGLFWSSQANRICHVYIQISKGQMLIW